MKAIHNKDYSVVKTLGCLVLQRGFFYIGTFHQET